MTNALFVSLPLPSAPICADEYGERRGNLGGIAKWKRQWKGRNRPSIHDSKKTGDFSCGILPNFRSQPAHAIVLPPSRITLGFIKNHCDSLMEREA